MGGSDGIKISGEKIADELHTSDGVVESCLASFLF